MQHIRNLKRDADKLHKEFDNEPGMFMDCIEAVMMEHRRKCWWHEKQKLKQNTETDNPS